MTRFLSLVSVCFLSAQVECVLTVSYHVERESGENKAVDKIEFISTEATGSTEDEARVRLQRIGPDLSKKALEICKQSHEDLALCVSKGLQSMGGTYERAGIGLKKQLEETVYSQCKSQLGKCKVEEDIKCYQKQEQTPVSTPEASVEQKK